MKYTHALSIVVMTCQLAALPLVGNAQLPVKAVSFPVSDVRLTSGAFKHAEDLDKCYLLGLDADRLLAPYLKGAGLTPKAENYTNWENTGLDGHIGGHYLSALSYMFAATGDARIKERLDYVLAELKRCQDAVGDGYLCGVPNGRLMWQEVKEGNIRASGFGLNDRWVPLYNIHKIYAGLRDAYEQTGNVQAKAMLVKLTDWMFRLTDGLTDEQMQDMLRSEHGGLNEVFADVSAITGDKRYLTLAHRFSHQQVLQPLLHKEDKLTGMHANTQIPKVIGFKRMADVEGNRDWDEAARYFWNTVVQKRSISIGGNSVREHFHPADDFSSMLSSEQGPETCNTYNMLRLTKLLYQTTGDASLMDYYERALYNHILSTQNPVQGGFVYFTPMRAGHYRVYSQPQTSFWCCVGSGLENHARYGEMIYAHQDKQLFVNLFIPSVLQWKEQGVTLEQLNHFPDEAATTLVISSVKQRTVFTLNFRLPEWTQKEKLRLTVNEVSTPVEVKDGYIFLTRMWNKGDKVRLEFPMHLRALNTPDGAQQYSFLYGPIVLAAKLGTQNQSGLFADDSRGGHIASGAQLPTYQMPLLVGDKHTVLNHLQAVEGKPLTFRLSQVSPSQYEGIELTPFYQLHECRYMVYFPLMSEQELLQQKEAFTKMEQERVMLETLTVDKVICGEQQPESDHYIRMKSSTVGSENGVHWRETKDSFTYQMKNSGRKITHLRIASLPDVHRDAILLINEVKTGTIVGKESVQEFAIPRQLQDLEQLEVTVRIGTSKTSTRLCEIRLLAR